MMMTIALRNTHRSVDARRSRRAFTLIELVAVIAIVGLIGVSVGGPTLSYLSSVRTRGAAARIASDICYAQRWAMSTRNRTWVAFDTAGNSFSLHVENPSNPGKAGRQPLARALDNTAATTPIDESPFTGVTLSSASFGGTSEVQFDSLGKPYDSNGTALSSSGSVQLSGGVTVTVLAVSGLAEVSG